MLKDRLRERREAVRLTQEQVANVLGKNRQAYNHYELGKAIPSSETLKILAELFDTSSSYLLGESNDPTPVAKTQEVIIPTELQDALIGLHKGDEVGVTKEEIDRIATFIRFIRSERGKQL